MCGRCVWWISANERRQGGRGTRRLEQTIKYLMKVDFSRQSLQTEAELDFPLTLLIFAL